MSSDAPIGLVSPDGAWWWTGSVWAEMPTTSPVRPTPVLPQREVDASAPVAAIAAESFQKRAEEPPPEPQYSPNGRYWWNGTGWVPIAQAPHAQVGGLAPANVRSASGSGLPQILRDRTAWIAVAIMAAIVSGLVLFINTDTPRPSGPAENESTESSTSGEAYDSAQVAISRECGVAPDEVSFYQRDVPGAAYTHHYKYILNGQHMGFFSYNEYSGAVSCR